MAPAQRCTGICLTDQAPGFVNGAIVLGAGADDVYIGSVPPLDLDAFPGFCGNGGDGRNAVFGGVTADSPGIVLNGNERVTIQNNVIGSQFGAPVTGPAIRVQGPSQDIIVGGDDPEDRNVLWRASSAVFEVGPDARKVVVRDNVGASNADFAGGSTPFSDLLPLPGFGNSGTANNGIQAPVITVASRDGVGGTGVPGALIRVLQQQRAPTPTDPEPGAPPRGYVFPTVPARATVGADGIWGVSFQTQLRVGQGLMASQTTADGSSEYASPLGASESNPPPLITFQSGPSGVVESRSATFTFSSNKPGTRLTAASTAGRSSRASPRSR